MSALPFLAVSLLLSLAWILYGRAAAAIVRKVPLLSEVLGRDEAEARSEAPLPSLSVIVTARDEAASIETTARRLLAQDYPGLEIVVVDDRSTDGTGEILDRLASGTGSGARRLTLIHNRDLPAGWLGKCHACRLGAGRARGEWLLFTDGDVALERPDLLARVVARAQRHGLDHVAVVPDARPMRILQSGLMAVFGQILLLSARAHEMDRDLRRGGTGVGAFNLVRRPAYERIGGHERLRLDPTDDVKLGMLLKESGARQRIYIGLDLLHCPWQRGTLNVIRGLEKNFFPGCYYSLGFVALITAALLSLAFGPPVLAALAALPSLRPPGGAAARAFWLAAGWLPLALEAGIVGAVFARSARRFGASPWSAALCPLAVLLLLVALWNSTLRILARGGVRWRDTFYPLRELRRGVVRPGDGPRAGV